MLTAAVLAAVEVAAVRLGLAAEMVVIVDRLLMAARLAARVAMQVMAATVLIIIIALEQAMQARAVVAVAVALRALTNPKPVAVA